MPVQRAIAARAETVNKRTGRVAKVNMASPRLRLALRPVPDYLPIFRKLSMQRLTDSSGGPS